MKRYRCRFVTGAKNRDKSERLRLPKIREAFTLNRLRRTEPHVREAALQPAPSAETTCRCTIRLKTVVLVWLMHVNQEPEKAGRHGERYIKVREFGGGSDAATFGGLNEIAT